MNHWPRLRRPNEAASGLCAAAAIRQNAQKVLIKCSVDFQLTQHPSTLLLPAVHECMSECVYAGLIRENGQAADLWLVTNTEQREREVVNGIWWRVQNEDVSAWTPSLETFLKFSFSVIGFILNYLLRVKLTEDAFRIYQFQSVTLPIFNPGNYYIFIIFQPYFQLSFNL